MPAEPEPSKLVAMVGFAGDFSTAYACPRCGAVADVVLGCGNCGGPPEPEGRELADLSARIRTLTASADAAYRHHVQLVGEVRAAQGRYQVLLGAARSRRAQAPAGTAPAGTVPVGTEAWPGRHEVGPTPEVSPRTVQNLLFILGGLLLGSAAIVFTAVAWASFGVGGRAAILATVTVLTMLVPPLVLRRRLTATAETFAALGLLLVVLDGYAAHRVNLAGLADAVDPTTYAGLVAAGTVVVAAGYAAVTGLAGPRFAALLVAQPVVPLLVATHRPGLAAWAVVFAVLAALDIMAASIGARGVVAPAEAPPVGDDGVTVARRVLGWVLAAVAGGVAALFTLLALSFAQSPPDALRAAGAATVVAAVVMLAAARTPGRTVPALLASLAVVGWAGATVWAAALAWPDHGLTATALVTLAVALTTAGPVIARRTDATAGPDATRSGWLVTGPSVGALVVAGWVGLVIAGLVVHAAASTAVRGFPAWHAALRTPTVSDWQLPTTIVVVAAAVAILVRRYTAPGHFVTLGVGTGVLVGLAGPAVFALPWWTPALVDCVLAAVLVIAARVSRPRSAAVFGTGAAVLVAHAVPAGLGRAGSTAAVLGFVVVVCGVAAALARVPVVRTVPVTVAVLAVPGLAAALGEVVAGPVRILDTPVALACAVAGLVATVGWLVVASLGDKPAALVPRVAASSFAGAAAHASVAAGFGVTAAAIAVPDAPFGVVAALAVLCAVVVARAPGRAAARRLLTAAVPVAAVAVVAVTPTVLTVLAGPYRWLAEVWTGTVTGTGLAPGRSTPWFDAGAAFEPGPAAVALGILTVAAALLGWAYGSGPAAGPLWTVTRVALPPATLTALAAATALDAPWPTVPIISLAGGLASLLLLALMPPARRPWPPVAGVLAVCGVGAGLAGSLATRAMTLAALGAVVVVAAVCGGAGRTRAARVAGWLTAAASGTALAYASGAAVDLATHLIAYRVLLAAASALAIAAALEAWRQPAAPTRVIEARALEAAAHAAATVAVLLTIGHIGAAAGVCVLWGLAIGLRALVRGQSADARRYRVVAATAVELVAYWLLLADNDVSLIEAYTVPAAAVAGLAGWLAARRRPGLSSWTAYGPALIAAFAPSVAVVLPGPGMPLRRLALGVAAVAVVLIGARWRLRAPFVVGGAVLAVVAAHEVALVWDLIPRWAPLAAAGLALVAVATTYERRRRDLARLVGAVGRMH
ncbi:SCO7613 C-terminal domain-containing membrane protein [Virgisporangium aurantiacum]|uniref:Uncharacterized protein n=1 Tax=Virgisporangium aurantiacum TaxID=175570 RepID=A0A8J4DZY5_9ACTN|nr:hypothetical protein [Virgisporangium aurantiacum]GIJ57205.1 hypothetical protein Vau01_047210 [Virgisporangium aurantiacum]